MVRVALPTCGGNVSRPCRMRGAAKRCRHVAAVWHPSPGPNDMKGNSNKPKGEVMAVFCISPRWTGICLHALTRSIFEKNKQPESLWRNNVCHGWDSGRELFGRSGLCSLRRDANRCPSWVRYVEQRTRNSQSSELCRSATGRRTRLWRL
jgi:hypothetical protein